MRDRGLRVPAKLLRHDEPFMPFMRQVARTLDRDSIVLDLGAHIGLASTEFAHYAGKVYAFEPHPELFQSLCHNVRHYKRIEPIEKAVSDVTGTAKLYFEAAPGAKSYEGSTIVRGKADVSYEHAFDVETVRLADFIATLGQGVKLIKMDVEGAEYRIVEDLIETPAVWKVEKIFVECHMDRVEGLADRRTRVESRIAELGLSERFDFNWP